MRADERDACGVGFLADLSGRASHRLLRDALTAVANMRHRGALAADAKTGDGAGVLTQIPHALLRRELQLPAGNANLAVGMLFYVSFWLIARIGTLMSGRLPGTYTLREFGSGWTAASSTWAVAAMNFGLALMGRSW